MKHTIALLFLIFFSLQGAHSQTVRPLDHVVFSNGAFVQAFPVTLPSGSFSALTGQLTYHCEDGQCDTYDRTMRLWTKNKHGQWVEFMRYITPFRPTGGSCIETIDLTDYISILQGTTEIQVSIETYGGYASVSLDLTYTAGTPPAVYTDIIPLWDGAYPFGKSTFATTPAVAIQPVPTSSTPVPAWATSAVLRMLPTGHGSGENNSQNAAEFYDATNSLTINGTQVPQHVWRECASITTLFGFSFYTPLPTTCSGQQGTWYYSRAGWCPGNLTSLYRYNLDSYLPSGTLNLDYTLDPGYVDYCDPANPNCDPSVCSNCGDSNGPAYTISGNLILMGKAVTFEDCSSSTSAGDFRASNITGQSGSVTVPVTVLQDGVVSVSVSGSGFASSPFPYSVNVTAGTTSLTIPIVYDGSGSIGSRQLTISSPEIASTCSAMVTVKSSLPVNLVSFQGKWTPDSGNQLSWVTTSESNNSHFEVHSSTDARVFGLLSKIPGKGTTSVMQAYTYTDAEPSAGLTYYRLKQVDFDGTFAYSRIIGVQTGQSDQTLKIYPNPASDNLVILLAEQVISETSVYSLNGRQVLHLSGTRSAIDIKDLSAGEYIIEVKSTEGKVFYDRFIKR